MLEDSLPGEEPDDLAQAMIDFPVERLFGTAGFRSGVHTSGCTIRG